MKTLITSAESVEPISPEKQGELIKLQNKELRAAIEELNKEMGVALSLISLLDDRLKVLEGVKK